MKKKYIVDMSELNDQELSEVIGILSRNYPGEASELANYDHTITITMDGVIPDKVEKKQ